MAIPAELSYANEDQFIQDFLVPLLQRLGFSLVVNYHGHSEFGKDLIFAELDRFGHVRYHALQAKYEPSISLNGVEDLIRDCKQAFANPFTHPQTGASERISSFYAVNAGSVSAEAAQHFFNSLLPAHGGNARLLQARDLLTLDKWAVANRREDVLAVMNGLGLELRFNLELTAQWRARLRDHLAGQNVEFPMDRLRADASAGYLIRPVLQALVSTDAILKYSNLVLFCNKLFDYIMQGFVTPDNRRQLEVACADHLQNLDGQAQALSAALQKVMQKLGPLAAL